MKKLLLLSLVAFSLNAKAQIEVSGKPIEFESVVKVDSLKSSKQLYESAIEWFAITFKNSKAVIQMQDKEAGTIVGKANFGVYHMKKGLLPSSTSRVGYTIKLYFKDGKYKYSIGDFISDGYGLMYSGEVSKSPQMVLGIVRRQYAEIQKECESNADMVIKSLNYELSQKKKLASDW